MLHRQVVAHDSNLDVLVVGFRIETDQTENLPNNEEDDRGGHAGHPGRCPSWLLRAGILYLHPSGAGCSDWSPGPCSMPPFPKTPCDGRCSPGAGRELGVAVERTNELDRPQAEIFLALLKERFPYVRTFVPEVVSTRGHGRGTSLGGRSRSPEPWSESAPACSAHEHPAPEGGIVDIGEDVARLRQGAELLHRLLKRILPAQRLQVRHEQRRSHPGHPSETRPPC